MPEILITAPKANKPGKPKKRVTAPAPVQVQPAPNPTGAIEAADGDVAGSRTPLLQVPGAGKTGTKLGDLPETVQIIPRMWLSSKATTIYAKPSPMPPA